MAVLATEGKQSISGRRDPWLVEPVRANPYQCRHVCAGVQRPGRHGRRLCHVIDVAIRRREMIMDKNRIEGNKHEVKGAVKEVAGKVTGNPVKEASGQAEKQVGKFQKEVGKSRDDDKKHT
jgi:uncharacterized protein YjbJ (UPF0337 family)